MMPSLFTDELLTFLKSALESRVAELLIVVAILALTLHYIAEPLQRIPDKMDMLILRLADFQQELVECNQGKLNKVQNGALRSSPAVAASQ
jgi:uncharacterized coiled-coil protein SlyX